MKKYICLNHGECNWADEKPPREFTLAGNGDENVCPNCESSNIREKPVPPSLPKGKIAGFTGLLLLIIAIVWLFILSDTPHPVPLTMEANSNCQTRLITLTTKGGDGSPVTYNAEGLKSERDSIFKIPDNQPNGSTITFRATQSGKVINFSYKVYCEPVSVGDSTKGPKEEVTPKWTRVEGSEFCVGDCIVAYSETDNLGHTRERRIENYEKCCPADK